MSGMVPNYDELTDEDMLSDEDEYDDAEDSLDSGMDEEPAPSRDFALRPDGAVSGFVSGIEAVKQAAYLILSTERYAHAIYSWDYGVEIEDLYGRPLDYCITELERRIKEALLRDDRIEEVDSFSFETSSREIHVTFTMHTVEGDIEMEREIGV